MTNAAIPLTPLCSICQKPVELETCKTDHNGDPVHEACYVARLSHPKPPSTHS
jgi:hypothetical protein